MKIKVPLYAVTGVKGGVRERLSPPRPRLEAVALRDWARALTQGRVYKDIKIRECICG